MSISEKIRKLLALANSSNINEANLAMKKAQDLMLDHNLTEATLDAPKCSYDMGDLTEQKKSMPSEFSYFACILKDHFFVRPLIKRDNGLSKMVILGKKENIESAKYVFNFLTEANDRLYRKFKSAHERIRMLDINATRISRKAFTEGLAQGFSDQLKEEKQKYVDERGLVLKDDKGLVDYVAKQFPNTIKQKIASANNDNGEYGAGYEQGKRLKLAKGIEAKEYKSIVGAGVV